LNNNEERKKGMRKRNMGTVVVLVMLAALIGAMGLLNGCATFQVDTQEKQYLAARTELNMLLGEYIKIQDTIKPEDRTTVRASFLAADGALDIWESMLGDKNYDYASSLAIWLDAKKKIIAIFGGGAL